MDILGGSKKTSQAESKPSAKTTTTDSTSSKLTSPSSSTLFSKSDSSQKASDTAASKPDATSPKPLSSLFTAPSGWSCPVCMVQNKDDMDKCPCCEEPKPGGGGGASKPPSQPVSSLTKTDTLVSKG